MTEATTMKSEADGGEKAGSAGPVPGADAKKQANTNVSAATKGVSEPGRSGAHSKASAKCSSKAATAESKAAKAKATPSEPRQTKAATVEALLSGKEGATLEAMCSTTGWQSHTCRAFLTGLRKKGREVVRYKDEQGGSIYRMTPPDAQKVIA
jgi:uncharacterized protein (DUF2336 family)